MAPWWQWVLGLIAVLIVAYLVYLIFRQREPQARTGREQFETTDRPTSKADDAVATDAVFKKDPEAPTTPRVKRDVSTCLLGQTGNGKSVTAKSLAMDWPEGVTIAHAVSEVGDNEFERWYRQRGFEVWKISTQGSTHRWDPFLDFEQSLSEFQNIAEGLFNARQAKETGWDEGAKVILLAALIETDAIYDDFAALPTVLNKGPAKIIDKLDQIENVETIQTQLALLDEQDQQTMFNRVTNRLLPLLTSDIFNDDLPRFSLNEQFETAPPDRVLLCDSIRDDRAARGFWRFFLQVAIDRSYKTETEIRFLLDEVDKLPQIANLGGLASAGRTAGSRGIIIAQNVDQLNQIYGEAETRTIWANSPNRFMFRPGDNATAHLAIDNLGDYELLRQSISKTDNDEDETVSFSQSYDLGQPILSSELFRQGVGEALVQTPEGWWLSDLTYRDVSGDENETGLISKSVLNL